MSEPKVSIAPVSGKRDFKAFVDLKYRLYQNDPNFVPPLQMERRDFLDPAKHPFFKHAEVDLFLARRHGQIVGRVAAIHDRKYNAFWSSKTAAFGLFECVDDASVARALIEKVEAWAQERGLTQLIGPLNFSTNYDCGLLIDGFDRPAVFLMPYNPRYYPELYDACGLTKAKDLWAWELSSSVPPPEKVARIAEKIRQREGVVVRPVRMDDFANEVRRIKDI